MNYTNPYNNVYGIPQMGMNNYYPQPMPQQNMIPVITTSIIPVDGVGDVEKFQVGNGQSQMFLTRDESAIYIKSATANSSSIVKYQKEEPPKPPEYVTIDQLKAFFKEYGMVKDEDTK